MADENPADVRLAAYEKYVVPETEVLARVAMSITRNHADAEDLVQDTLLRAYRAIDRFDGRHPRAWLLTIMRNAQHNRVRRRRPSLFREPEEMEDRLASITSDEGTPEEIVAERTFDSGVVEAVRSLSPKLRDVIAAVDMNGLSYREAADVLGVPVGTVMSRLHRARGRVRKELARKGIVSPKGGGALDRDEHDQGQTEEGA